MERPWTYYLLLVVAWLAALWGVWQIGEAWLTWPAVDSALAREAARAKMWAAGALLGGGLAIGGLATLIRLVQDGFARLAQQPRVAQMPARAPEPLPSEPHVSAPAPADEPPAQPAREAEAQPAPRAEPQLTLPAESTRRAAPGERPRLSEAEPRGRREPKFTRDG